MTEHHSDYQCLPGDGGVDCFAETTPGGFGRLWTEPLGFESDFNDVRPAGAPTLEWYYFTAVKWTPRTTRTATGAVLKSAIQVCGWPTSRSPSCPNRKCCRVSSAITAVDLFRYLIIPFLVHDNSHIRTSFSPTRCCSR